MSQPQDASNQASDRQPAIVYVPVPFNPSSGGDLQALHRWQQSLFWQMNPQLNPQLNSQPNSQPDARLNPQINPYDNSFLGSCSQIQEVTFSPFYPAETPSVNVSLTIPSQIAQTSADREREEDREFERQKRRSEGNFGKIIFCITYCYILGAISWFFTQGGFRSPSVATASPADVRMTENSIANIPTAQIAIAGSNVDRSSPSSTSANINATLGSLPIVTAPTQAIPVPPPPAPESINTVDRAANNHSTPTIKTTSNKTQKNQANTQQLKPTKLPAVVKTPPVIKIPSAPELQIVTSTPNNSQNNQIDSIPAPPPPPSETTTGNVPASQPNTVNPTPVAMVGTPPALNPNVGQGGYRLMGVIEMGELSSALFQIDGVTQTVKVNEVIGNSGWRLVAVVNGRVTLSRNNATRSLGVEERL